MAEFPGMLRSDNLMRDQSGHLIQLRAPIPADMFVKFLQAKTYNPAFARWRIDAEASYRAYS